MRVYVNDTPLDLLPGMTVRHALIAAGLIHLPARDQWGNEIGPDGALTEGMRLYAGSPRRFKETS